MPERRGGSEEDPDFQWLYGDGSRRRPDPDRTQPMPRTPRPESEEHTRVMPAQPRPAQSSRPAPPPVAPPPGGHAPARGDGYGGRGRRRRFGPVRLLLVLVLAWLLFLVAVPLWTWSKVDKVPFTPEAERPAEQPGTTYLLVGSDSRADLTAEEREALNTGDWGGQRADTIMLLHTGSGPNLLVSIPRDSNIDVPGHGVTKINAAYAYGGAALLTQTIESATGIRIDDYVEIGMGGVAGVVDAVGGVEVCPKEDMTDPDADLDITAGCQEVDGRTALAYARSRKTSNLGDIDRAERQREVVSAVGGKVASPWTVVNPLRWWNLNSSTPDFFRFGEGTSPLSAGRWAFAMTRITGDSGMTCGVPIVDLAVTWDEERAGRLFTKIIQDDTDSIGRDLCTPSGLPRQ